MEEFAINPGEAGENARVLTVGLAGVGVDGAQLTRIGNDELMAERDEEAADLGAMGANLHRDKSTGILRREPA